MYRSVDLEANTVEIRDLFYNEIVKLIKLNNPSFEPSISHLTFRKLITELILCNCN
jgi:hypothetical protein